MFFDDGRPAYISLPDLHVVCKPSKEVNQRALSACVSPLFFPLTLTLSRGLSRSEQHV